jgi:hypothetical protein
LKTPDATIIEDFQSARRKMKALVDFDFNLPKCDRQEDFAATEERRVKKYFSPRK